MKPSALTVLVLLFGATQLPAQETLKSKETSFSARAADVASLLKNAEALSNGHIIRQTRNTFSPKKHLIIIEEFYLDPNSNAAELLITEQNTTESDPLAKGIMRLTQNPQDTFFLTKEGIYHHREDWAKWRLMREKPDISMYLDRIQWLSLNTIPVYANIADMHAQDYAKAIAEGNSAKAKAISEQLVPLANPVGKYAFTISTDGEDWNYQFTSDKIGMIRSVVAKSPSATVFNEAVGVVDAFPYPFDVDMVAGRAKTFAEAMMSTVKGGFSPEYLKKKVTGLSISRANDKFVILYVIVNSPAHKAGLQTGDQIVAVNNVVIEGKTIEEVNAMILSSESVVITAVTRSGEKTVKIGKTTLSTLLSETGAIPMVGEKK